MGGKLTIRIVCLVGLPVIAVSCAALGQPLCGQSSLRQSSQKAGKASRIPETPGVEIPTQESPIADTVSSRSLPTLVPASAIAAPARLRAGFNALRRAVAGLGPG